MFATWYWSERTLSVHTIVTTRREAFYWPAILLTFALGTSAGDFLSEQLELDYLASPKAEGGLGLGTNLTSIIFLSTTLVLVVFLAISKRDVIGRGGDGSVATA